MTKIDYAGFLHKRIRQKEKEIIQLYDELGSYIRNLENKDQMQTLIELMSMFDSIHEADLEDMDNRKWERIHKAKTRD